MFKILLLVGFGGLAVFECFMFIRSIINYFKSRKNKPPNINNEVK